MCEKETSAQPQISAMEVYPCIFLEDNSCAQADRYLSHSCNNWTVCVDSPQTSHAPKAQMLSTVYSNHAVCIGVCIPHTVNVHAHVFASVQVVPDKSTPTSASQFNLYAFAPHSVWTYTKGQFMVSQNVFSWRAVWSHHNLNVFIVVPNGHVGRIRIKSWVSNSCVTTLAQRV